MTVPAGDGRGARGALPTLIVLAVIVGGAVWLLDRGCTRGPPEPPPVVLRLWRGEAAERARARAAERGVASTSALGAAPATAGGDTVLYSTRFDDLALLGAPAWYRVVEQAAPAQTDGGSSAAGGGAGGAPGALAFQRMAPKTAPLVLQRDQGWAAVTEVAVGGGVALSVRLRIRTPGAEVAADVPVAALVESREPLDSKARLGPEDVAHLLDAHRHATHELAGPLGKQARELRADFVTDRETRWLAVYLLAPFAELPRTILVDELVVARRPLARHVAEGGELPRLLRLDEHGAVRIELDRDTREGLLALPGSRHAFDLGPSPTLRQLDLSVGVVPTAAAGGAGVGDTTDIVLTARGRGADGQAFTVELREFVPAVTGPELAAWQDLSIGVPASPVEGVLLELSASASGSDPPLVVFGHPTVRAPRVTAAPGAAGGPPAGDASPADSRPNVVLISLDTLRPDRLSCYGGEPGLTPHLDALAAEGLRFTQASSTSSYTLPSHGSLLTGQYPAFHGAVDIDDRLLPERSPFLARQLADAGWVTAAFTGGGYVSPEYGFAEGFDRYSSNDPVWALDGLRGRQLLETVSWERAPVQLPLLRRYATPMIAEWIGEQQEGVPFFLFLHTYIVHNYAPERRWIERRGLLQADGTEAPFNHQERARFNAGEYGGGPGGAGGATATGAGDAAAMRERIRADYLPYYDATIGMADEFVGAVLGALEAAGLSSRTLVVVTSDHGEEFGEHCFFGHGETLFEGNTRVPLIVRLPAGTAEALGGRAPDAGGPVVVESPISLVDLAPWILRICGVEPDTRMSVRAPLGPDSLAPPARSQLFIELDTRVTGRLSAVRDGGLKLHAQLEGEGRDLQEGEALLYDLAADPDETRNLLAGTGAATTAAGDCGTASAAGAAAPGSADHLARLQDLLRRMHALAEAVHPRGSKEPLDIDSLDPQTRENLEQLGYIDANGNRVGGPPRR
jgi:arylsulfatase A-like enzyme